MSVTIRNTYGTPHSVSEGNPTHVTGCDRYRLPLVGTIIPGNPGYPDMVTRTMARTTAGGPRGRRGSTSSVPRATA